MPEGHESPQGAVKPTKADSASLPREQGTAVGTPAYMPPEQAEGAIDQIGPRSDVYGLGAILYELLTGKRPIVGTTLIDVLHRVGRGDIKPPRQVRPEIPAPLEAVCLKALALRPDDRYSGPRALAADIKAWLADEPVSARRDPFADRARRWAKRHRTAVTSTAAALLVGLVGLGTVASVLAMSNRALDTQRRRAEDREVMAIDAVKKFRDAVASEPDLKNTPALEGLRKRLLREPLAFFRDLRDRLQADRDTRPESLARLALASFELGKLTSEIGDKQDALIAHQEARTIWRKLLEANPNANLNANPFQSRLAAVENNIGVLLNDIGKPEEALQAHRLGLTAWRKLADANPTVTEFQSGLATSDSNISVVLRAIGKPIEALQAQEAALKIRKKLAEANPASTSFQSELAASHNNACVLLSDVGKLVEALQAQEAALAIQSTLAEANPTSNSAQSDRAASYNNIGVLLNATGKPVEALKAYEAALAIHAKLAEANPTVTEFQSGLAYSHNNLGLLRNETSHPTEALKAFESAQKIWRKLTDANPNVTEFPNGLATVNFNIGDALIATGKLDEAKKAFEAALVIQQTLVRDHPDSPDLDTSLGLTLNNLGMIDLNLKQFEAARIWLRQAVQSQRKALASNPSNPTYRNRLVNHLTNLRDTARGLGDTQGITEAERELTEVAESDPAMLAIDARLSAILQGGPPPVDNLERLPIAQRAYDKALHATAASLWADALAADTQLAEARQPQTRYNAACSAAMAGCGQGKDQPPPDIAARAKLRAQALQWLQAELSAWTKVVESGPTAARPFVAQTLQHWREDTDLAGIREPKALEALA